MTWEFRIPKSIDKFLDGSWPLPLDCHEYPIGSSTLFSAEESSDLFYRALESFPQRSKHHVFQHDGITPMYAPGVRSTDDLGNVFSDITGRLQLASSLQASELTGSSIRLRNTTNTQVLGYGRRDKFIEHADSHILINDEWQHNTKSRKWSSVCWLTSYALEPRAPDEFNGGSIYFPYVFVDGKSLEIFPKAGQLIVFPSHPVFVHGIKPVFSGYRVAIVNFWDTF